MNLHADAYGQLVHDFYHGTACQEIIERSDGLIDTTFGPESYFTTYPRWLPHQQEAINLSSGRVLDIGCGAGRHALYLQEKGINVVGIDISPLAIQICKERGVADARVLDISKITKKIGTFDTILMLGNNFGLFGNSKRAKRLLKLFHSITSENGTIIAESIDPHAKMEELDAKYQKKNTDHGELAGYLKMRIRYKDKISNWFDYLTVSKEEMVYLLQGTGWTVSNFIGNEKSEYIGIIKKQPNHP